LSCANCGMIAQIIKSEKNGLTRVGYAFLPPTKFNSGKLLIG